MPDPLIDRDELTAVLRLVESQAEAYLGEVDDALVRPPGVASLDGGLLSNGTGSLRAMSELISASIEGATRSGGPRFFHFVMGGVTPAALGADWLV